MQRGLNQDDELMLGNMFSVSALVAGAANLSSTYLHITTLDSVVAVTFEVTVTGKAYINAYSGATYSAQGSTITPYNKNTISSNAIDTLVRIAPTVTGTGTKVGTFLVPGGTTGGTRVGASKTDDIGFILAKNTDYLFEVSNQSGAAADIGFNIQLTEVPTGQLYA